MPHRLFRSLGDHPGRPRARRGVSVLLHLLAVVLSLHLWAGAAAAQPSCTEEPCPGTGDDVTPPTISISPESGTYVQPSIPVVVGFGDDLSLDPDSLVVKLNGTTVTSAFQYTPTPGSPSPKATARGTITLATGSNTLEARMCDLSGNCWQETATYAYGAPGVSVTPDGGAASVQEGTSQMQAFTVTNTGPSSAAFNLQAVCRNVDTGASVTCTSPSTTGQIAAGGSAAVNVSYTAPAVGSRLSLELRARQSNVPTVVDAGWAEVDVYGTEFGPDELMVSVWDLNSSPAVARDECVTVSVGSGAAYECGDLRLVHGVPGMMALGRGRAPVLLYNSQHAHPRPTVYADVTLPQYSDIPTTVVATVALPNGATHTRTFAGSDWKPAMTRRIGVQWDGLQMPTGPQAFTLLVTAHYPEMSLLVEEGPVEVMVVNWADSPFGPGWWLAGLERIQCVCAGSLDTRLVYTAGDGSARMMVSSPLQPELWIIQNPAGPPDTVTLSYPNGVGQYTRKLRGGGEIHFDESGRHMRTVSRLGDTTHFVYDGTSDRLTYVSVPRRDGGASGFRFTYSGGYVTSITPEVGGVSQPGITIGRSSGRLTAITDPDGLVTRFGYGDANNPNRITSRTSRDTTVVTFSYDAAGKLSAARLALSSTDTITTQFTAAESRGVHPGSGTASSVAVSQAYTLIDGPRTDVADETRIWVRGWGAPRRIRDALGHETVLIRGNAPYPALVTEVRGSNARGDSLVVKSRVAYDFRGRVDSATVVNPFGNGQNLTTRYRYDDRWDAPDTIIAPGVGATVMAYDTLNGNVLWQQQGDSLRRVYFKYHASGQQRGLLAEVRYPNPSTGVTDTVHVDSLGYDGRGNLRWTRSPLGHLTYHYRDRLGRDSLVVTPVHRDSSDTELELAATGTQLWTGYDVMGRVTWTQAIGRPVWLSGTPDFRVPPRIAPEESLRVETVYDAMGRPKLVRRWSTPDSANVDTIVTQYQYDRAGRKTVEATPGAGTETIVYHPTNGTVTVYTSRGHQITTHFDALGRMVRRDVPASSDAAACPPGYFSCTGMRFPFYSTSGAGGFAAPAETFLYRYDAAGNQVYAENMDAQVSRTYHPGGALKTDTTRMRTYAGMDFSQHVYGLTYLYDAFGRLQALQHPTNLTSTAQADSFAYDTMTGAMKRARSRQGHVYQFQYDLLGQLVRTQYPGGGAERMTYDLSGRRFTRVDSIPTGVLSSDTLLYDARGKMTYVAGVAGNQPTHFRNWYSGLGNLLGTDWQNDNNAARLTEALVVDAMGNQALRTTWPDGAADPPQYRTTYSSGTGRITRIANVPPAIPSSSFKPDSTFRHYDVAGNVTWGVQRQWDVINGFAGVAHQSITRNYYDADGVVRAVQVHDESTTGSSWTYNGSYAEYRYDPLGRRIMERTRRDSVCSVSSYGCESTLTRFVWAGDQLLWELRVPGGDGVVGSGLESTSASGDMYGRVSYFHAGGIDKPLLITKEGVESVVPRETWRGQFHKGTSPTTGAVRDCTQGGQTGCLLIAWPGWKTSASHAWGSDAPAIDVWYGGLVDGMRDASGQMYMRNRYYDPATGQFTQTDPIGLAGGLNAYGFAAGDPVTYSDPYGLCAQGTGDTIPEPVTATYCSEEGKLRLYDLDGKLVYETEAGNNTTNPEGDPNTVGSNGPAPEGTFPVQNPILNPQPAISYGPAFFPVGACGTSDSCSGPSAGDIARRRGIGIHGGRRGPQSRTQGCIRVSNSAITEMARNFDIVRITIGCPSSGQANQEP